MADNKQTELLLLNATKPLVCDHPNKWNGVNGDSVTSFIDSIETSIGTDKEATEKYRTMISGVPSPWARVTITRKALAITPEKVDSVLSLSYMTFRSEWRGLIAAYVLHPDSFEFSEPIALVGPTVSENMGDMSVLETYGEMLFDDQPLWTLKREKLDKKKNPPCIQVLYFKNAQGERIPVGATSPFTFLFSSINYDLRSSENEIRWISNDGKFIDPSSGERDCLSVEEKRRLHAFLFSVSSMISPSAQEKPDPNKFYLSWLQAVILANEDVFPMDRSLIKKSIDNFRLALTRWADEIAESLNGDVNPNVPVNTPRPKGPLSILLNSEKVFYLSESTLFTKVQPSGEMIKNTEVFMDSEYIAAWRFGRDKNPVRDSAAFYLGTEDQSMFFALPFTTRAFAVFKKDIAEIMKGDAKLKLSARCVSDSQVEIKLYANLDNKGSSVPVCQKTYRIQMIQEVDGKVFAWPNFYSTDWKNYYYYSEFPTNGQGIRMIPKFDGGQEFMTDEDREKNKNCYLVRYPVKDVEPSAHKYEIIRTQTRVNSVQIWNFKDGKDVLLGTLLMRTDAYVNPSKSPAEAIVGIDFGSTNTCAYYRLADGGGDPSPVPFSNRRMAIVGFDNQKMELAHPDELLFISNEGTQNDNGQVKSWLHDHNLLYLTPTGRLSDVTRISEEIVGGIPVNESNIDVKAMDRYTIQTNAGTLYYNMKWLPRERGTHRKTSFLRMLWIHICADLYANGMKPSRLNWSFPSAMSLGRQTELEQIFNQAAVILGSPFVSGYKVATPMDEDKEGIKNYTEAEADCAFSINRRDNVNDNSLVLGIDIGGSTSDILVMGMKTKETLFAQSSVRIASGFFFDAITRSVKFRGSLKNFVTSKVIPTLDIRGIDSIVSSDVETYRIAPYFLNNVFDQLRTDEDFRCFYSTLNLDIKPVFALPAYVTGLLVFYSGMLVRNAIKTNDLDIQKVTLRHFGKGGRLFEWISDIHGRIGEYYYSDCFEAGVGEDFAGAISLEFGQTDRSESKSEVAKGLVCSIDRISSGLRDPKTKRRIIQNFDIVGEDGVEYVGPSGSSVIFAQDIISDDLFDGGIHVKFPGEMKRFSAFLDIFLRFVGDDGAAILSNVSALLKGKDKVKDSLTTFILNDPEYSSKSSYRQPVIIIEALAYLNDVLLPLVAREIDK